MPAIESSRIPLRRQTKAVAATVRPVFTEFSHHVAAGSKSDKSHQGDR